MKNKTAIRIPIWRATKANEAIEKSKELYDKKGSASVIEYANEIGAGFLFCQPCNADMPVVKTPTICQCLVCGSEISI